MTCYLLQIVLRGASSCLTTYGDTYFKPGDSALWLGTWRLGIAAFGVIGSVLPPEAVAVSESLQASES